jgi:hypothetical protein
VARAEERSEGERLSSVVPGVNPPMIGNSLLTSVIVTFGSVACSGTDEEEEAALSAEDAPSVEDCGEGAGWCRANLTSMDAKSGMHCTRRRMELSRCTRLATPASNTQVEQRDVVSRRFQISQPRRGSLQSDA